MNWEAAINPTPLGILSMPGGMDSAGVLVGELHDEAFRFQRDGSIFADFWRCSVCSVCYFAAADSR
jgi:hypothetical protein